MNIKRIRINGFGKFENTELEFSDGLNIIYGENESGKSTLQMFIKAMFYGLKGGRATASGIPSQINRYRPWHTDDYGGVLEYQLEDGKWYRLERNFDKNTATIYDSNFNDISSLFEAQRNKIPLFAEEHLGLTEESFEKTIFIKQMDLRLDGKENSELLTRLSNISTTGSEDVSFDIAERVLKENIKKCLGTGRTTAQPIDKIEAALEELREERDEVSQKREEGLRNQQRLQELEEEKARRQVEKEYLNRVGRLIEEKKKIEEKKEILGELAKAKEKISHWQKESDKLRQELLAGAELRHQDERGKASPARREGRANSFRGSFLRWTMAIMAIVASGAAITALFNLWLENLAFGAVAAGIIVILALLLLKNRWSEIFGFSREKTGSSSTDIETEEDTYYEEKLKQLDNMNMQLKDCFSSASMACGRLISTTEEIHTEEISITNWLDIHKKRFLIDITSTYNEFAFQKMELDFFHIDNLEQIFQEGNLEWLEDSWRYSIDKNEDELLELDLKTREYQLLTRDSEEEEDRLQAIDEELAELLEEKEELQIKGQALTIALETLQEAAEEMRNSYTVELNNRIGSLVSNITSARYSDFRIDDNLRPMTINPENNEVVNALLLSAGTVDQVYLAVRLAASEILMEGKEKLPLLLDEIFAQFDDERVKSALEFFYKNYSGRQILLFTCKEREVELAREIYGQSAAYHILTAKV